jgi:MraZ protein
MFRGSFEHTVDTKGRISIPARFREVLKGDDRMIITNFTIAAAHCLDVYPLDEWLRFEEDLKKKPRLDPRMVDFQNYYLSGVNECVLDKQGRILIPPLLRQYAGLKRDVVLVSAVEKFRVWDKDAWKKVFTEAEDKAVQDPGYFGDLGI